MKEEKTKKSIIPLFEDYVFSEVKTIVDVVGNIGILMAVILKPNLKRQAILFDKEDIVVSANQVLEVVRLVDKCQIVGRNFFDSLLRGGALYLLSRVLLNTE